MGILLFSYMLSIIILIESMVILFALAEAVKVKRLSPL